VFGLALAAYSGDVEHPFRAKPNGNSGASRTAVPRHGDHSERSDAGMICPLA